MVEEYSEREPKLVLFGHLEDFGSSSIVSIILSTFVIIFRMEEKYFISLTAFMCYHGNSKMTTDDILHI